MERSLLITLGALIGLQAVDAGLHVAINEAEPLRIMSNLLLVVAISLGAILGRAWRPVIWGGAIAYVALNLVFVAIFGLENPVSGVNRTPLFGFMALSLWLAYRVERLRLKEVAPRPA